MRAVVSYLTSAIVHLVVLAALANWSLRHVEWQFAVDGGQAITLSASIASAMPASSPVAFEAVKIEFNEPATSTAEANPSDAVPTKQPTVPPELTQPLGEIEIAVAATVDAQEVARQPSETARPTTTSATTSTTPAAQRSAQTVLSTSTAASLAQSTVRVAGANVDRPPRMMPTNRAPDYPLSARIEGSQGRVLLLVRIDDAGHVAAVSIRTSSGDPRLDDAAEAAVGTWRFYPSVKGGSPAEVEVLVPIRFSLRRS